MRRISLAIVGISALLIGLTQVAPTGAVPAKIDAPTLKQVSAEPTEREMRRAFEGYLSALVSGTLALVHETGGPDAVRKVQQQGNDKFDIRSFRKIDCVYAAETTDFQCSFAVDIAVAGGSVERTMSGRFATRPAGVVFAEIQ